MKAIQACHGLSEGLKMVFAHRPCFPRQSSRDLVPKSYKFPVESRQGFGDTLLSSKGTRIALQGPDQGGDQILTPCCPLGLGRQPSRGVGGT